MKIYIKIILFNYKANSVNDITLLRQYFRNKQKKYKRVFKNIIGKILKQDVSVDFINNIKIIQK